MIIETGMYLLLGAIVGILAGLLGVGGGLIIVPVLAAIFSYQGISPEIIMHLALGTSLASILATSVSSVYSHHKRQAISWPRAIKLTPGILVGAWCGGLLAGILSSDFLKPVFAFFELGVAVYMLSEVKTRPHNDSPSQINFSISGGLIGFVSSLVGIGGGTMTVPWLMWHGSSIHKAIATSAAVGFPIALAGSVSYLFIGWNNTHLPDNAIGFIYLPALAGIIISSIFFAPVGASWAHSLEVKKLKKVFAVLLISLAIYLLTT